MVPCTANPSCTITIDLAGPLRADKSKTVLSSKLKDMAQNVVSGCVAKQSFGGFDTDGIGKTGGAFFNEGTLGQYPPSRPFTFLIYNLWSFMIRPPPFWTQCDEIRVMGRFG